MNTLAAISGTLKMEKPWLPVSIKEILNPEGQLTMVFGATCNACSTQFNYIGITNIKAAISNSETEEENT